MEQAEFGSSTVTKHVRLKHIDALWKLLRDYTVADPFENVRPKYRVDLDEKQTSKLISLASKLDLEVLLPAMKEFITTQLTEDHTNVAAVIKEVVGWLTMPDGSAYLNDMSWFTHFPDTFPMKHMLSLYKTLEDCQRG